VRFQKGQCANPNGRPKGARNKLPRDLAERIMRIADDLEARGKGLLGCAEQNPFWLYTTFMKPLIPKNVQLNDPEPLVIRFLDSRDDPTGSG
jgi:hypothetical protein